MEDTQHKDALLVAQKLSKSFPKPDGKGEFTVLSDVSLELRRGEILALLGRSGSGKSTLLRALCGLHEPTAGRVLAEGQELRGPNPDVAMVFQSFALLPWLTVQENVEVGLEAQGVAPEERHTRALQAIDMVGLDGFESAYPKELSGGMRQRVGFARAFVMRPKVLFMDEPFSALDVLTAANLRGEISDLWEEGVFPSQSILIVTHNIEEAVLLADRIVVLGTNPGRVRGIVEVDLKRPRSTSEAPFQELVDYIYTVMTNPEAVVETPDLDQRLASPYARLLPQARAGGISGLLEILDTAGGEADLPVLAARLQLTVDELLPFLEAATLLGFATVADGDIKLTASGRDFATTTILRSKDLFREQALGRVPVLAAMAQALRETKDGTLRGAFFQDLLDSHHSTDEAQQQFATAVDWGRYAEIFEYDAASDTLRLTLGEG